MGATKTANSTISPIINDSDGAKSDDKEKRRREYMREYMRRYYLKNPNFYEIHKKKVLRHKYILMLKKLIGEEEFNKCMDKKYLNEKYGTNEEVMKYFKRIFKLDREIKKMIEEKEGEKNV
jgi:hypothetical protein